MYFEKIKRAIETGLFSHSMCKIVTPPSLNEISAFSKVSKMKLSEEHISLLSEWGGSNLDEIRINSLDSLVLENSYIEFANDYNGFIYKYDINGAVVAEDTDGGEITHLANSVSEFINNIFLGKDGGFFYGQDWVAELIESNIA